jgi:hypothetical protein
MTTRHDLQSRRCDGETRVTGKIVNLNGLEYLFG